MTLEFDYFVVFAEMRTGSNFLEANLNTVEGLSCLGEAFNPSFIGYPKKTKLLGVTQAMRDGDPQQLLDAIRSAPGLNGFRYFHNHDPRVLDTVIADPRCAKIILTRNPVDSYVSLKIARATGQWKLTDVKRRKAGVATFDADEFAEYVETLQAFQVHLLNRMQATGQTAFYLAYEDLQSLEVLNGLACWLGATGRLDRLDHNLKPQNPTAMSDKVTNPDEMDQALARLDRFALSRTPNFEPRRGPAVPTYIGAVRTPLLYLPIEGGPNDHIAAWLAALDDVTPDDLTTGMNQKGLRDWKRNHSGHRSFTVLHHPVSRAHHVFCTRLLRSDTQTGVQLRAALRHTYKIHFPSDGSPANLTRAAHREAFLAFLDFVKSNLAGQTTLRVDPAWSTQVEALRGFGSVALPDLVLREADLGRDLPRLAGDVGITVAKAPEHPHAYAPVALADIYDASIENKVADVYKRDYQMFGFAAWSA